MSGFDAKGLLGKKEKTMPIAVTAGDMEAVPAGIFRRLAEMGELSIRLEGSVFQCVAAAEKIRQELAPIEPKFLFAVGDMKGQRKGDKNKRELYS